MRTPPDAADSANDGAEDSADEAEYREGDRDDRVGTSPRIRLHHGRGYGVHQLPNHLRHQGLCAPS